MKNIVVLGTGVAAMPLIRQTMRNTVLRSNDYKLIVVSPSTQFYWPLGVPRAIIPGEWPEDAIVFPLEPSFKDFPSDKFEFINAGAESVEPQSNIVTVAGRQINYHTLIIATGSSSRSEFPWRIIENGNKTKNQLEKIHKEIEGAKSIAIVGGGISGTETAGELGYSYARYGKKDVYYIYSDDLPLPSNALPQIRKQTVTELTRLKVKLMPNTSLVQATKKTNGDTTLELKQKDGSTKKITVNAYIPATGLKPNTSFMPSNMLNEANYIKQDHYLNALGHPNIFIVGDAGSLQADTAYFVDLQSVWLIKHLPEYFETGKLAVSYKKKDAADTPVISVALGQEKGTGQFGNWRLPSLMIWYVKSRYLGTDYVREVALGKRTIQTVFEKPVKA